MDPLLITAVRYAPKVEGERDTTREIKSLYLAGDEDLLALRDEGVPAAFLINSMDADRFTDSFSCIHSFGTQKRSGTEHKTIRLAQFLLRHDDQIPLARTCYQEEGRLEAGIKALLVQAHKKNDHNIYLIAAKEKFVTNIVNKIMKSQAGQDQPAWPTFLKTVHVDKKLDEKFLGQSRKARDAKKRTIVASKCDLAVLIAGETGTGKEILARAVHDRSTRANTGQFVSLNCAAISPHLLEGELFGIEPGIVTDVKKLKIGLWEKADKGSLFLDEIGNMSLDHQARILRALEEGTIRRVGGTKDIPVDARIIVATNKPLATAVADRTFLPDLYFRVAQLVIRTPSLAECPQDLTLIAQQLWKRLTKNTARGALSNEILDRLPSCTQVGNVRQLRNVLLRVSAYMDAEGLTVLTAPYFDKAMREPIMEMPVRGSAQPQEIVAYRGDCLAALRKTARLVRKCQVLVRPLLKTQKCTHDEMDAMAFSLEGPCNELATLCLDPTLFHDNHVFAAVARFSSKVARARDLLADEPQFAPVYWNSEVKEVYRETLSLIATELRTIEEGCP